MIVHHLTRDPAPFQVRAPLVKIPPSVAGGRITNKPDGVLWCWPAFGGGQSWPEFAQGSRETEVDLMEGTRQITLEVDPEGLLVIDTQEQARGLPWRKFAQGPSSALAVYGLDWMQLAREFTGFFLTERGLRETAHCYFPGMIDIEGDPGFEMVLPVTFDHWSVASVAIFQAKAVLRVIREEPFRD